MPITGRTISLTHSISLNNKVLYELATSAEAVSRTSPPTADAQQQQQNRFVVESMMHAMDIAAADDAGGALASPLGGLGAAGEHWGSNDVASDSCSPAYLAASVVCGCGTMVRSFATDAALAATLASEPALATALCTSESGKRLAAALVCSSELVSAIRLTPGLGSALAQQPHVCSAVAAEDGRLAVALSACGYLAAALAPDVTLAAAVSGWLSAENSSLDAPGAIATPSEDLTDGRAGRGESARMAGSLLAERVAREPALLPALTPGLLRIARRSIKVGGRRVDVELQNPHIVS